MERGVTAKEHGDFERWLSCSSPPHTDMVAGTTIATYLVRVLRHAGNSQRCTSNCDEVCNGPVREPFGKPGARTNAYLLNAAWDS